LGRRESTPACSPHCAPERAGWPSLTVLRLTNGVYVETARVAGSEPRTVDFPFEVTLRLQR